MAPSRSNAIRDWVDRAANETPDKVYAFALVEDRALAYGELQEACLALGRVLREKGIGAGGRVALLSGNSLAHLTAYIGVMYSGATMATVHVEMNAAHMESILKALAPKLALYEAGFDQSLLPDDVEAAGLDEFLGKLASIEGAAPPADNAAGDIASIFYTSGTTDRPKGILCSFEDLTENVAAVTEGFGIAAADVVLDYRSFNWMSAQTLSALGVLAQGATLIFAPKFSRSKLFDWAKAHAATVIAGNPTVISMLINEPSPVRKADLPALRYVTSSSAPLLIEDWKRFESIYGIPVVQGYGASECGWIAAATEADRRIGSVGKPLPYHDLAIVDDAGNRLPAEETGEVELGQGGRRFLSLTPEGALSIDGDGRMRTGDIGHLDANGFLFVTGRKKDLIIRGGVNISPLEIDNVLREMPGVSEACAVGIADPIYGQSVGAYVVQTDYADLTENQILAFCRKRLAEPKVPAEIRFRHDLPKTERGKLDRKKLQEMWAE